MNLFIIDFRSIEKIGYFQKLRRITNYIYLFTVPPMMWVPQQQISAYRGSKGVTLECVVEAHPEALTFWEKGGRMLQSGNRFHMNNLRQTPSYKVIETI